MSTTSNYDQLQLTIVPKLPDYSKHPFVIKKRRGKRVYKKYGIPESFKKKK